MADNPTQPNSGMTFDPSILNRGNNGRTSGFWGNSGHWAIFLFAIGIYILDLIMKWFSGIDLVDVARKLGTEGLLTIIWKGVLWNLPFWIIILFIYFVKKPADKREFLSIYFLWATIWLVLTLTGVIYSIGWNNLATIMHLAFIVFSIKKGMLDRKKNPVESNITTAIIILVDFFLFNLIHFFAPEKTININMLIFPVLILASLIYMDDCPARTWAFFLLAVFYAAMFISTYKANINFQKGLSQETINTAANQKRTAWENIKSFFTGTANSYWRTINGSDSDIYAGQVEANQGKQLGVFLEDMKASETDFYVGDQVQVWVKLKAYSFEENPNPINITVTCYAKDGNQVIPGTITPKEKFTVASFEEEFITCNFDNTKFKTAGYPVVVFNATFNFETQSYLKSYYIDKERKRTLQSQGVDIFTEYGITDRAPVAVFTNGPVKIGMQTTPPPIGVPNVNSEFTSYIGLTIDNHWTEGNVKKIDSLSISLPPGLEINNASCPNIFNTPTEIEKVKTYTMTKEKLNLDNSKGFSAPKSYMCSLKLNSYTNLLGTSPLSIKYFKTNINYIYMISESTTINIKPKPTPTT